MAKVVVDVKNPSALNDVMSCVCFKISLSVCMMKLGVGMDETKLANC